MTPTNGKGDSPRNCFSKQYKDNYETINWTKKNPTTESKQEASKAKQALFESYQAAQERSSDLRGMR